METIREQKLRVPIKSWLPRHEIEHAAMAQLRSAARHPAVAPHIAVMPDCHPAERVTVGCVLPAQSAAIPGAVGSDIGCGMTAIDTGIEYESDVMVEGFWRAWGNEVRARVPVGYASHEHALPDWDGFDTNSAEREVATRILAHAPRTLGTLGGGNHFLEAQVDNSGHVWMMAHSGSRVAGLVIYEHYDRLARHGNQKARQDAPGQLWWLSLEADAGRSYMADMDWACRYASENRRRMLLHMLEAFGTTLKGSGGEEEIIDCHHNFARVELHGELSLVVHRKGATSAGDHEMALIPGSMGTLSYVVEGLGEPQSLRSCSHGAGRALSRSDARARIDVEDLEIALLVAGTHTEASGDLVNEAPQAYKPIDIVMERQTDLIRIVNQLRPLMTVKG